MATQKDKEKVKVAYRKYGGVMYQALAEDFLRSRAARRYAGKVQLIFTSPPFPLNRKKNYGNYQQDEYIRWLAKFAGLFRSLLKRNGSIVIEMGNAWQPGKPLMSTLALRALLRLQASGAFNLCQQFIAYNPARLPGPAEWVNVRRIRVKDAYTHLWWMSPSVHPKANNRRVLVPYSDSMNDLLRKGKYNAGKRPSEHKIGEKSFFKNNGGAIPSNVLIFSNTNSTDQYQKYCRRKKLELHPARMQGSVAEFFIKLLTTEGDVVFDPFAGSNTTGAAAQGLNRRWVAVEIRKDYIAGSKGRFGVRKEGR
jgi:site-specific DNA-methyltransferase (cytosine-N4-specific)